MYQRSIYENPQPTLYFLLYCILVTDLYYISCDTLIRIHFIQENIPSDIKGFVTGFEFHWFCHSFETQMRNSRDGKKHFHFIMAIISNWVFSTIRTNPTTTFVSSCQVFAPFLKNPYVYVVTNVLLKNRDFPLGRKGTKRVEKSSGIYHLIVTFPKVKESTLNPTFPKGNPPQSTEPTMILIFP